MTQYQEQHGHNGGDSNSGMKDRLQNEAGVCVNPIWLESCRNYLSTSVTQNSRSNNNSSNEEEANVLYQVLNCDLRNAVSPSPNQELLRKSIKSSLSSVLVNPNSNNENENNNNISSCKKITQESFQLMVQVEELLDVSKNAETRLSSGPTSLNAPTPAGRQSQRCLKMLLCDGMVRNVNINTTSSPSNVLDNLIVAMEVSPIPNLSVNSRPGIKILISSPIEIRFGILMLHEGNTTVLGGHVPQLIEIQSKAVEQAQRVAMVNVDPTIRALISANNDFPLDNDEEEEQGQEGASTDVVDTPPPTARVAQHVQMSNSSSTQPPNSTFITEQNRNNTNSTRIPSTATNTSNTPLHFSNGITQRTGGNIVNNPYGQQVNANARQNVSVNNNYNSNNNTSNHISRSNVVQNQNVIPFQNRNNISKNNGDAQSQQTNKSSAKPVINPYATNNRNKHINSTSSTSSTGASSCDTNKYIINNNRSSRQQQQTSITSFIGHKSQMSQRSQLTQQQRLPAVPKFNNNTLKSPSLNSIVQKTPSGKMTSPVDLVSPPSSLSQNKNPYLPQKQNAVSGNKEKPKEEQQQSIEPDMPSSNKNIVSFEGLINELTTVCSDVKRYEVLQTKIYSVPSKAKKLNSDFKIHKNKKESSSSQNSVDGSISSAKKKKDKKSSKHEYYMTGDWIGDYISNDAVSTAIQNTSIKCRLSGTILEPFFGMPAKEMKNLQKKDYEKAQSLVKANGKKILPALKSSGKRYKLQLESKTAEEILELQKLTKEDNVIQHLQMVVLEEDK